MIRECENHVGLMRRFGFPAFAPRPRCVASSATPRRGSCGSCAGGKNGLWIVRTEAPNVLRSQDPSSTRPLLWRHSGVSGGDRDPPRQVDCRSCGAVKQEVVALVGCNAEQPFYTKRFASYVGRRCRASTVRDVARELRLDWKTVKSLEMESDAASNSAGLGTPRPEGDRHRRTSPSAGGTTTAVSS